MLAVKLAYRFIDSDLSHFESPISNLFCKLKIFIGEEEEEITVKPERKRRKRKRKSCSSFCVCNFCT